MPFQPAMTAKCLAGTLIVLLFTYEPNRPKFFEYNELENAFQQHFCVHAQPTNKYGWFVLVSVSLSKTVYRDFCFINNTEKKKKNIPEWKQQIESFIYYMYMYVCTQCLCLTSFIWVFIVCIPIRHAFGMARNYRDTNTLTCEFSKQKQNRIIFSHCLIDFTT